MIEKNLQSLLEVGSVIIEAQGKTGKITFLFYLLNFLYKDKAIIFTPQEKYLFQRRVLALSTQFPQFKELQKNITPYYLDEDWNNLKQRYGYTLFLEELEKVITTSEEKIIVIHRFGEYFEFQDRYEIENVYKTLIKIATKSKKKIIFLSSSQNDNFEYIKRISEEFTDVSITITSNEENERLLNIKDVLHNKEYPLMHFRIHEDNFLLDAYQSDKEQQKNKIKNILIAELDQTHDNMKDICKYIFNTDGFNLKYADSLQSILQEVFISPDIIIVFMKREQKNFDTVSAIKKHLPDSSIIGILEQEFVRAEDMQEAYSNGCDELFANNLSLGTFILTLQKASKSYFYAENIALLPQSNNILSSLQEFKNLAQACIDASVFFTAFTMESDIAFDKIKKSSRNSDYVYQIEKKIYYIAISTMPKDIQKIVTNYKQKHPNLILSCIWEPINRDKLETCI